MSGSPTSWLYLSGIWLSWKDKWKNKFFPLPPSSLFGNGQIVPFITEQDSPWRPSFLSASSTSAAMVPAESISNLVFSAFVFYEMNLSLASMTVQLRAQPWPAADCQQSCVVHLGLKTQSTIYVALYVQPSLVWAQGLYCLCEMLWQLLI